MADHDAAHTATGWDPLTPPFIVGWEAALPDGVNGRGFAVAENALCLVGVSSPSRSEAGALRLFSFRPGTGQPNWTVDLGIGLAGTPAIESGRVIVALYGEDTAGTLNAYALEGKKLLWSAPIEKDTFPAGSGRCPSPSVWDGKAWLPGANGKILRWDVSTGAVLDPVDTGLKAPGKDPLYLFAPAVSDQGVFAVAYRDRVFGMPIEDPVWRPDIGGNFTHPPSVIGPYLFVAGVGVGGGGDPGVGMIESISGDLRWVSPSGNVAAFASDGSEVYSADDLGFVAANPSSNGHTQWVWEGKSPLISLVLTGGGVVAGDVRGKIHLLSPFNGDEQAVFSTQDSKESDVAFQQLAVAGGVESVGEAGTLFYVMQRYRLLAFRHGRYGDLNLDDDLNITDVVLLLRAIVGLAELEPAQVARGDVAPSPGAQGRLIGDGGLDVTDALSILRRITGLQPPEWPYPS